MTQKRGWLWIALVFGLAVCSALVAPAGRSVVAAGNAQPPLAGAAASPKAEAAPEVWPQVSAGLRGTLATLEAERKAAGFVRRQVATSPPLGGLVETMGWSGEDTIIVVLANARKRRVEVCDLTTGAGWTTPLDLPAFEHTVSVEYTFLDETGPAPILLVWYPWYDPHSAKVVWAARIDCAAKRVIVLSDDELEAVRERAQMVAAPDLREDDPNTAERLRVLRVISGNGKTLRTVALPDRLSFFSEDLWLPMPAFGFGLAHGRTVAYGADPPSFLFRMYPGGLMLDPLLGGADSLVSPQIRLQPDNLTTLEIRRQDDGVRQTYGSVARLAAACVSVTGDRVAFARRIDTDFTLAEPACPSYRMLDVGDMGLMEVRLVSPDYGIQLVDFTAQVRREWPTGQPPPGQSGPRAYFAEPPDVHLRQLIGIEGPWLSPSGRRIVYLKNDVLWLAERRGDGGGPAR
jgi:hypothetical protein